MSVTNRYYELPSFNAIIKDGVQSDDNESKSTKFIQYKYIVNCTNKIIKSFQIIGSTVRSNFGYYEIFYF